ncbi:MAG: TolC family protein [Candidatus Dadabacteria bacterium]|nr:TolC family protein [Candidatus Dadabacteria bacterium]NIS07638.1 TolC family protein [Candidatus Dadabacteria bacterium]NIV42092.1 TolC family protein [Candidatus Dadabacteria bacterium]NIX16497.1 TolC family protein [Candidatus Dadabacteria bacterium]NIY21276.1 TolC family protein [Candidatus Dadabacteria bacterium]
MKSLILSIAVALIFSAEAKSETVELTLKEALVLALQNNRDIKIERFNVDSSKGEVKSQKGTFDILFSVESSYSEREIPTASTFIETGTIAEDEFNITAGLDGRLPTGTFYDLVKFSATRTKTDSPIEVLSPNWFTNISFSVGQDLLRDFGLDVNLIGVITAKRNSDIAVNELEKRISDVFLNVEIEYWGLVGFIENLELQKKALELAKDLQRRNEIQVDVGVLPPITVTQAKSEVAARQVDVITAENNVEAVADRLKNILVLPLQSQIMPIDDPNKEFINYTEKDILDESLKNRPEIKQAKLEVEKNEKLRKFYSNQRLPRLSVQGTIEYKGLGGDENQNRIDFGGGDLEPISEQFNSPGDAFDQLYNGDFMSWSILGVFSYPIFNWQARGDYIKAKADLNRTVIEYDKVIDDINLDVRNSMRLIENSKRRIEAADISVDLASQVLSNEEERLKVGIGTTREVLEAQRDLVDARASQIRAIADYNIALARLEKAKGTIIQSKGIVLQD